MLLETHNFEFGEFLLDTREKVLLRDGKPLPITPKGFQLLFALLEKHGHLVEKDELMRLVWADSFVEESNITFTIGLLRRLLEDDTKNPRFIETVPKRGYRFIAHVRRVEILEADARTDKTEEVEKKNQLANRFSVSSSHKSAVVALADWRRDEANGNEASPLTTPEESAEQIFRPKLVSAKPRSASKHFSKYRLQLFATAAFIIGAIAFGFYFYSNKKASSADEKKSIAVLPLKPINTSVRDEIYEIGIADSLIIKLGSMKGFIVRPLSATRKYADIEQDAITAGREQQVNYVLASNYQLAGGRIRVTAQLFNVATGQIEETYKSEKDAGDVFAMQDAIAGELGNVLLTLFATTENSPAAKRGTNNEEAYRLYLQGRNLTYNQNAANARKAIDYFQEAVRLDPNFARAYSGMAHAIIAFGNLGGDLPRVEYPKAREAVKRALELDKNLGEAHAVSGEYKFVCEWDFGAAEKDLLRAIELEPNSDLAHELYASFLSARGRFDEAIAESKAALEINPGSPWLLREFGRMLYLARRYDEAIIQFTRATELDGNFGMLSGYLFTTYELKGNEAAAYEWFMKFQKQTNPERLETFQNAYETAGWQGVRLKFLEFEKLNEQKPSVNYYRLARQAVMTGDKEQTLAYLNKAVEKHHGQLIMLNVEPPFDSLRDDPSFDELVRRVGLK